MTVSVPPGSGESGPVYRDDVFLETLTFGGRTLSRGSEIRAIRDITVLSGRRNVNAEWGDNDTAANGDADPFTRLGADPALQETTDPDLQDRALTEALSGFNLSEMADGEGGGSFSFRAMFEGVFTIGADDGGVAPDFVLFERGRNDNFALRLITEGPEAHDYTGWFETSSRGFARTGLSVNTREINGAQEIGVGEFRFESLGLGLGQRVVGLELRAGHGQGPDVSGIFLTTSAPFTPVSTSAPIPVPYSLPLLAGALAFLGWRARTRRS